MDVEEEDGHVGDELDALRLRARRGTPAGFSLGCSVLEEEEEPEEAEALWRRGEEEEGNPRARGCGFIDARMDSSATGAPRWPCALNLL